MMRSPIHASAKPLPDHRVRRARRAPRDVDQLRELALEADLLGERRDAPLEAEQAHRDAPALPDLADDEVGLGARVGRRTPR